MFSKPVRGQRKLRMGLDGPPGSGKTKWGLSILSGLCQRIAVIDTERGSSALYLNDSPDFFDFDMVVLGSFDPRNYIEAIQSAEREGYEGILIDSGSHAYNGRGGLMDIKDKAVDRSGGKNEFVGWKEATPIQDSFVDAILQSGCHVVMTMRSKIAHVLEPNASGSGSTVRKMGLEPIQRPGIEYEFDAIGSVDQQTHNLVISKTRCAAIDGEVYKPLGRKSPLGGILAKWLSEGTAAVMPTAYKLPEPLHVALVSLFERCTELGIFKDANGNVLPTQAVIMACVTKRGVSKLDQLSEVEAGTIIRNLEAKIEEVTYDPLPDKEEVKEEAAQEETDPAKLAFAMHMRLAKQAAQETSAPEVEEERAAIDDPGDDVLPQHVRPEKAEKPGKKGPKTQSDYAKQMAKAEAQA